MAKSLSYFESIVGVGGGPSQMEIVAAMAHVEKGLGFPEGGWTYTYQSSTVPMI
jgi:hypothetical protein